MGSIKTPYPNRKIYAWRKYSYHRKLHTQVNCLILVPVTKGYKQKKNVLILAFKT